MIAERLDSPLMCSIADIAAHILAWSQRMRVKCIGLVSLPSHTCGLLCQCAFMNVFSAVQDRQSAYSEHQLPGRVICSKVLQK